MESLPSEIIIQIISYITACNDIVSLLRVSRKFQVYTWEGVEKLDYDHTIRPRFVRRFPHLAYLSYQEDAGKIPYRKIVHRAAQNLALLFRRPRSRFVLEVTSTAKTPIIGYKQKTNTLTVLGPKPQDVKTNFRTVKRYNSDKYYTISNIYNYDKLARVIYRNRGKFTVSIPYIPNMACVGITSRAEYLRGKITLVLDADFFSMWKDDFLSYINNLIINIFICPYYRSIKLTPFDKTKEDQITDNFLQLIKRMYFYSLRNIELKELITPILSASIKQSETFTVVFPSVL